MPDSDPIQSDHGRPVIRPGPAGRGSRLRGSGRFERIQEVTDWEQVNDPEHLETLNQKVKSEFLRDASESVVSQNKSPDVDFNFSLNPYRGCAHGCSYCYARPTHEYLGFNAGLDFETKIVVKYNAPTLFRKWLQRPAWNSAIEPVMLSGVTDCYQPCEKEFKLTRACLEIALQAQQPMRIITKNALVKRDLDLLTELARQNLVCVTISLATLDQSLVKTMEPRSSSPLARLKTIEALANANVPVKVLTAPLIPALNDQEIPQLLQQASDAGATYAGYVMLRLPTSVEPVFMDWLDQHFPDRKSKIIGRLKSLGGGEAYDPTFGTRMKGQGIWAEQIKNLFNAYCAKWQLKQGVPSLRSDLFRRLNEDGSHQGRLF
ncbi:MAG: DNA repair photolyase [Mariniblastus sp.]|jgi:DNA repair photolyase